MQKQFLGILEDGVTLDMVSRDEVVSRLSDADVVLLPHGFDAPLPEEETRTIFPTRTIEYLICRRPILAHAPHDCYLTRFLREHSCALIVDEPSVPALVEAIDRLRTNAQMRADLVRNALQAAASFHAPRVAATLRDTILSS